MDIFLKISIARALKLSGSAIKVFGLLIPLVKTTTWNLNQLLSIKNNWETIDQQKHAQLHNHADRQFFWKLPYRIDLISPNNLSVHLDYHIS